MTLRHWVIIGLVTAFPASAGAQAITRADLLGAWSTAAQRLYGMSAITDSMGQVGDPFKQENHGPVTMYERTQTWTFRDDSTWTWASTAVPLAGANDSIQRASNTGKWHLSGDTLWMGDAGEYIATLKGHALLLASTANNGYELKLARVDTPKKP